MILIRQEKNTWIIEIKESWNIYEQEELQQTINFLINEKIPFTTNYIYEGWNIEIKNATKKYENYEEMKKTLAKTLEYKKKLVI